MQLLAGRTEVGILFRKPGEVLAAPDVLAHVAEAGGGNERRDAESAEVKVVRRRSVLRIRDQRGSAETARPPMLPEHLWEEMFIGGGAGGGHGRGDHLPAPPGYGQVGLVGEMPAEVRPVDEGGVRVGPA